ncbi:alpha/beta fold hydrolase [Nocardioides sp. Kera G14]|uniref:alpha/beta fold hydrolase n=1 Tax=Nocardioides sp. Kera G14 TaxID=2884264 RepID=UPI001D10E0D1|nr:alpha/beta hydrolase [Nocardioides sp. Kera G14]UDY25143.1 alpha/beta hydrolase [Nocardioides sp. Kera G14]
METDRLGPPYTAETLTLTPDDEGDVIATLVKRPAKTTKTTKAAGASTKAVLHIHGFSDYFFQKEFAEWWTNKGYDFYALDLRKYGRSLLPHQTPAYVTDLQTYYEEIDQAWERIVDRDGHTEVVVTAHSTGGLTMPLWAHDRRPEQLVGMVLNSPWFDLQGSTLMRVFGTPVIKQLGARRPKFHIRRHVSGVYARSLHRDHEGEWDFELDLKPLTSFPVYAGWLKAIRDGHARLHAVLDVPVPVLVLSSDQSHWTVHMTERAHNADLVLDVQQIRRWATAVGSDVTYKAIVGARHDVVLSLPEVRGCAYDVINRWLTAWVS